MKEDAHLWQQFLDGGNEAYSALYEKYIDALFAYGVRFTPNRELVKDCIQDVFVKIYSHRNHLKPTDNVKFYLFVALKNILLDYFRGNAAIQVENDFAEPVFDVEFPVEEQMIADEQEQERSQVMNRVLDALTSRQKEVIYYRYVEGMDLQMICELMQMNYQSVQNLIQRSIKKLKTTIINQKYNIKFYIHQAK
ncbi:MAG: sigma-70 family RNA polymerase sigma factor [Candidatus Symbiothrix sp.]|jgi:RNA polymerase sigma factor (sigma-70 family)|nr:sigma-70 family RNA polymerase sigma factor [Candidatus Symbiothrix sp.]